MLIAFVSRIEVLEIWVWVVAILIQVAVLQVIYIGILVAIGSLLDLVNKKRKFK